MNTDTLIVIVDDSPNITDMLKIRLKDEGYENVFTYENPLFLLEDIGKGLKPDIIITDYRLPWMTGYELLEIIKNNSMEIHGIIITACNGQPNEITEKYTILGKDTPNFCDLIATMTSDFINEQTSNSKV